MSAKPNEAFFLEEAYVALLEALKVLHQAPRAHQYPRGIEHAVVVAKAQVAVCVHALARAGLDGAADTRHEAKKAGWILDRWPPADML